ncbi:MAG TPA: T9SS type A sorting domain-containing protein [Saprospiraceae bacterium]|nr:T9SS type A sorting domain-containing protein [Saprospiraceae bacterium]
MIKNLLVFFILILSIVKSECQISLEISNTTNTVSISAQLSTGYAGGQLFGYYFIISTPEALGNIMISSATPGAGLPTPDLQNLGTLNSGGRNYYFFNSNSAGVLPAGWTSGAALNLVTFTITTQNPGPISVDLPTNAAAETLFTNVNGDNTTTLGYYFSDIIINGNPTVTSILPIRLQSFTAKKFAANTSLLEWTTASEENSSHIEIERSMDAKSWSYVATEKARGSLNYSTDYSFVDAEAVLQRDRFTTVYYRLKLVDNDESFVYSEVRSVTFDNNGIVSLEAYPNPSTEVINLRMAVGETNTNTAQMMMLDMTGKLVKKQTVSANGISVLEVDQLETGVYNIIVKHEDKTYQKRVIKTN